MEYETFAALYEEATDGWVWFATPSLEPHRLVRLTHKTNRRKIYCECRVLDSNFVKLYNERPNTRKIDESNYGSILIINDWYRSALGIPSSHEKVNLEIVQHSSPFWAALRSGSQHPNPTVRLGNRLGVLGTWLGLSGLIIPIAQEHFKGQVVWAEGIVILLGFAAVLACLGVRR
jgi:hypothetical protein